MYESIVSDAEASWRHVIESQRHLPSSKYNSLTRQMSPVHTDTSEQWKASTLPRKYERSRSDRPRPKSANIETESVSVKYYSDSEVKCRKGKLTKPSVSDLRLLETVTKVNAGLKTETIPRDVTDDVTLEMREITMGRKNEKVCEPLHGGSVGPVFRRGRRSRPSAVAGRRSSVVATGRRGKSAAARRGTSSGRVPPVGAAVTPVKADGPAAADWEAGCLARSNSKDSDEESYVTAYNSTPMLSRSYSPTRKDQPTQQPDNQKSIQTGKSRRRRRRLKSPDTRDHVVEEPPTVDQPEPQVIYSETTQVFVPIPVIVLLLCLYVMGGTVMFRQLYGVDDWSAAAFVSLAAMLTVGGWYPDHRLGDHSVEVEGRWISWPPDARFVYALWVVVGLAVVSASLRLAFQTLSNCLPCNRQTSTDSKT